MFEVSSTEKRRLISSRKISSPDGSGHHVFPSSRETPFKNLRPLCHTGFLDRRLALEPYPRRPMIRHSIQQNVVFLGNKLEIDTSGLIS